MYGYVYKTTNKLNKKIYIGQHNHSTFDDNYYGSGSRIRKAIADFGLENFSVELIEFCKDKQSLNETEEYYILYFKSFDPEIGYNLSTSYAGDITFGMNDEEYYDFREKSSGKNNGMFESGKRGIHPKGFKGHHHSLISKDKISKSMMGDKNPFYGKKWADFGGHPKGFKGHHHSDDENWKHQVSLKITKPNGDILEFSNMSKAVRELKIPRSFLQSMLELNSPYKYNGNKTVKNHKYYDGWLVEKI